MIKAQWIIDPGHAWLKIKKSDLGTMTPSSYSYIDDKGYVYLEEDCEAPKWLETHKAVEYLAPDDYSVVGRGDCYVRELSCY